jgi:DNA helicase II / ATP-dependent DNA helicase PcrA
MLSTQQATFCDWVETGTGSAILRARAGTGKTFTLIEALKRALKVGAAIGQRVEIALLAYNNKIAKEIEEKVAKAALPAWVGTFHKAGFGAWRKVAPGVKLEGRGKGNIGYFKFDRIADELDIPVNLRGFVKQAVSLAKQRAIGVVCAFNDPIEWRSLVDHFDLEDALFKDSKEREACPEHVREELALEGLRFAAKALKRGCILATEVIDFDDMIYMPLIGNVALRQFDFVLVDEAQDTNPARRELAKRMLREGGRAIFVGDDRQAIYGFTGADNDSLDIIGREFNCAEYPLTVTYRCPKAVVNIARTLVPDYEAHPEAPEGSYSMVDQAQFEATNFVVAEDAILCRNTKPLVDIAFSLIRRGIACHVEGKEIGKGLIRLVNRYNGVANLAILEERLEEYREKEVEKLMQANKEVQADGVSDRVDTVIAIMRSLPASATTDDLRAKIDGMFADTPAGQRPDSVTLMTIHRSKGLEFKRVFLYGRNKFMPSPFARQEWQFRQEENLEYVGLTRAQETLVEVTVYA